MRAPLAAGLGSAGAAALAAWLTAPLPVARVVVTGHERLSRGEIVRLAGVRLPARVTFADARQIERRLRESPMFESVRVARGFTGTLHLGVTERAPVAWLPALGCAAAADGRVLPHFSRRESGWVAVGGLEAEGGRVSAVALAQARALALLLAPQATALPGALRRWSGGWDWEMTGRRVRCSSPVREAEIDRMVKFRAAFPAAWEAAGRVDVRFADRVVVAAR